jgi:NhaP-type Na+/H+ or K+/H+ antiporter
MILLFLFLTCLFAYGLVSQRLERLSVTSPIAFVTAGTVVGQIRPPVSKGEDQLTILLTVAEIGLVLLLFSDASRSNLRALRRSPGLPVRLLTTGMVLTFLLGALAALAIFPELTVWQAGILGAILAPTDAGLGQVIVNSPRVPARVRQALSVEAGLNDGLSVPFLLFCIALSRMSEDGGVRLVTFMVEQLGYGTGIGLGIGLAGGWLLAFAHRRKWMSASFEPLAVFAMPLICLMLSDSAGASMFIAAFVAGLAVQVSFERAGRHSVEFTEEWGQLLNLSVFFLFGLLVAGAWTAFDVRLVAYAVLSLTIVRMLPVAVAMRRSRVAPATVLFMGWFGPRGLASIVLGLVYLESVTQEASHGVIRLAVMLTVLISVFAHGLSASPGIRWYERRVAALDASAPERLDIVGAAGEVSGT